MRPLPVENGIGECRIAGEHALAEVLDAIREAIAQCRERRVSKLLVDASGVTGLPVPRLIDRFLLVEELAGEAKGAVAVAMAVPSEYLLPGRFAVKVAKDFGLTLEAFTSVDEARAWLAAAPLQEK